jgi:hypothetical protein
MAAGNKKVESLERRDLCFVGRDKPEARKRRTARRLSFKAIEYG